MDMICAGHGILCGADAVFAEVQWGGVRVSRLPGGLQLLTGVICLLYSITRIELWELKKRIEIGKRPLNGSLIGLSLCFFPLCFYCL